MTAHLPFSSAPSQASSFGRTQDILHSTAILRPTLGPISESKFHCHFIMSLAVSQYYIQSAEVTDQRGL